MLQIRLPDIQGGTPAEQIAQIRSYLYQLASELQWALETVGAGGSTTQVSSPRPTQSSEDLLQVVRTGDNKTLQQAKEYTNSAVNSAIIEALEASY